jgi:hypothetical protein
MAKNGGWDIQFTALQYRALVTLCTESVSHLLYHQCLPHSFSKHREVYGVFFLTQSIGEGPFWFTPSRKPGQPPLATSQEAPIQA